MDKRSTSILIERSKVTVYDFWRADSTNKLTSVHQSQNFFVSCRQERVNLPKEEAASIPTTVTVVRNALLKSNPVTQSSPRQQQAK
jgi:hypothetical protein